MARSRHQASLTATAAHSIVPCQMRVSTVASAYLPWATQWLNRHSVLMFSSAAPPSHAHPPPVAFPSDGLPISWESSSTVRRSRKGVGILPIEVFITAGIQSHLKDVFRCFYLFVKEYIINHSSSCYLVILRIEWHQCRTGRFIHPL